MRRASNSFACVVVVVVGAFVHHPANATTRDIAPIIWIKPLWRVGHYAPRAKRKIFICKKHRARKRLRGYIGTVSAGLALIRNP
uniref:Secreted protein n=1 Tax=Trichogramma kaykai TaxID=54128 RepID=A0ABD2WVD5_9HYME